MDKLLKLKCSRYLRVTLREFVLRMLSPFDSGAFLAIIAAPLAVTLTYYSFGLSALDIHLGSVLIGAYALLGAYITYGIIWILLAPLAAWRKEREKGFWDGNKFIYHKPILVLTKQAIPEENGIGTPFKVTDPEANTFIWWKTEVDNAKDRVMTTVDFQHDNRQMSWDGGMISPAEATGGIITNKAKKLYLHTCLKKDTSPVIVRVYITAFEVFNQG